MPSDVDDTKEACILTWISSILHRSPISSNDLNDGVIFLDLLCLTKDFSIDVSKLERPIDRFCRIEEILDEFFHTSSVRFVNYEEILQPNDESFHYNVIACALLILTVGLQSKNSVLFMKSAQKLRDDLHMEIVTLTEELVKVDTTNPLTSDMLAVLKQSIGNVTASERDCSTPILPTHPPFGFVDSPLGPLQSLLQSPQIIQKTRLREKEMEIRRLRAGLENERKARAEMEVELQECQRRGHKQEQLLEEAVTRMRCAERQGREWREDAENAIGYRQRAESAEQERDRLRVRLERMQSSSIRNRGLEEEVKELHAERVSLRQKLETFAALESRVHQLTLDNKDLRDQISKASSEVAIVKQARDMAVDEASRASEVASELRRQVSEARFSAQLNVYCPGGDSAASTPNTEYPPIGEPMSLVHEKRVVELERYLDELQAGSVPRTDYEELMKEYDNMQDERKSMSEELTSSKAEVETLKQKVIRLQNPMEKFTVESYSSSLEEHEKAVQFENERWNKAIVEAVDEVLEEEGQLQATSDTPISDIENADIDRETIKSSGGDTSDTGCDDGNGGLPPTDAHIEELMDNRRSLAHEIVELNSQFEDLQQQNETLIDETDRMRQIMSDDIFSVREELEAVRDHHTILLTEFGDYQTKMQTEFQSLASQIKQLMEVNSQLRCEMMEHRLKNSTDSDLSNLDLNGENTKLEMVASENSALLQMMNNLKEQVKCLLMDPMIDDEANYICNGRADSPFNEEECGERLGLIIDEFCASMFSITGRLQEDNLKRKEIEDLQVTLNHSLETNAKLGTALQEANASIVDKDSCLVEMKNAKNSLVDEVDKLKRFIHIVEASLENSEHEFKAAFDSLRGTAEQLGRIASEKQECIVQLQRHASDLSEQKIELINRVSDLESEIKHHQCSSGGQSLLSSTLEESVHGKLASIEHKLEELVADKGANQSLSENVIEMSLENENMAATIKHLEEVLQQFTEKMDALSEQFQEKEFQLNEAVVRLGESEMHSRVREQEISQIRLMTVEENTQLKEEQKRLQKSARDMEKSLTTKSSLCETLALQLTKSESRLKELEAAETQLLETRTHLNLVERTNARLKEDYAAIERECGLLRETKSSLEREAQAVREVKNSVERQRVLEAESMRERVSELSRVKDAEIARLTSDLEAERREKEEWHRKIEQQSSEIKALTESQERSQRRLEEIGLERKELIEGRDRHMRRSTALQLEIEELNSTIKRHKTELEKVQSHLKTSVANEEDLRTRLKTFEREESSLKMANEEEYKNELLNYKRRISTLEERIRFLEEEIGRLEKQAMEWRSRADSYEEKNKVLDMNIKRYAEGYESKRVALKEAYEKLEEEGRMKEHYKAKASSFEEEVLPFRRRQAEITAENRRLNHHIRSLEAQVEYANRMLKSANGKTSNMRQSLPPQTTDYRNRIPPFPAEDAASVRDFRLSFPSEQTEPRLGTLKPLNHDPLNPTESHRISELQRRNFVQPDHMKTSYPVETQSCDPRDVAEILGSSSTTTVVRQSLAASLPPTTSSTFSNSEMSSLRPEVLSPPRMSTLSNSKSRPSSTPLVLQDLNVNTARLSPVPQREPRFSTVFEIHNSPKGVDLRSSLRGSRSQRPKSYQNC